ncbi:MAG: hypothetical protein P4L67_03460, partial [Candidatus Pacebacteria bacterium]|nr:hypothetical protein [Candidatus Paceibacterota bacterium]
PPHRPLRTSQCIQELEAQLRVAQLNQAASSASAVRAPPAAGDEDGASDSSSAESDDEEPLPQPRGAGNILPPRRGPLSQVLPAEPQEASPPLQQWSRLTVERPRVLQREVMSGSGAAYALRQFVYAVENAGRQAYGRAATSAQLLSIAESALDERMYKWWSGARGKIEVAGRTAEWEHFKRLARKHFIPATVAEDAVTQMMQMKQGPQETMVAYTLRVQETWEETRESRSELPENTVMNITMKGMDARRFPYTRMVTMRRFLAGKFSNFDSFCNFLVEHASYEPWKDAEMAKEENTANADSVSLPQADSGKEIMEEEEGSTANSDSESSSTPDEERAAQEASQESEDAQMGPPGEQGGSM